MALRRSTVHDAAWRVALLAAAMLAMLAAALAEEPKRLRGVALVIGQSAYEHLEPLENPENDTRGVERLLDELGFDVSSASDRDHKRLVRELERFVEDAAEADVALLYYSGHGIEAGGENYLVPVDADLSALDAAGERLVPLSGVVERLKATVPVTILLLDACRSNPFPAGAMVRPAPDGEAVPAATGGLGSPRGAVALSRARTAEETYGTVIGFAAEPGKVALDGPAGGMSPYAAALLRHLAAMKGEEFGTVLRMVAEEVYLKTGGRQRPWVNESLRRLLYFGSEPELPKGAEGDILVERRRLLLTIATLPEAGRKRIEAVAAARSVPMDALYGMLRALGAETPSDPDRLDEILAAQADRLKGILAERDALAGADPEIVRITAIADRAIGEGALQTALALMDEAKQRAEELSRRIDDTEARIRERRIEIAAVFAKSAETNSLSFRLEEAARDFRRAFEEVERWDAALAETYRRAEAQTLIGVGSLRGDTGALARAVDSMRAAAAAAIRDGRAEDEAASQYLLGFALYELGRRRFDLARIREAEAAYRRSLEFYTREDHAYLWAMAQNNLGIVLQVLIGADPSSPSIEDAIAAFSASLEVLTKEQYPIDWARSMNNLALMLAAKALRDGDRAYLEQAERAFRDALTERTRDRIPLGWAQSMTNLARTLFTLGQSDPDNRRLEEAVVLLRGALEEYTRERAPSLWADTMGQLGYTLMQLGQRDPAGPRLEEAAAVIAEAIDGTSRDANPLEWARLHYARAASELALGMRDGDVAMFRSARTSFEAARSAYHSANVTYFDAEIGSYIAIIDDALSDLE